MITKFLARFRKKKIEEPAIKVTPYDVAHGLYLQMIQRPVQEHDEIVYTFLRLHCPKKHLHSNPRRRVTQTPCQREPEAA